MDNILLFIFILVILGLAAYLGWDNYKKNKGRGGNNDG